MAGSSMDDVDLVLKTMAQTIVDNTVYFSELDAVVGDGDFGYSLQGGFEVVLSDFETLDRTSVGSLLFTTLHPSCPKLMLNVESDDYARLQRRSCGCPIGELGFDDHLSGIRSHEKLTSDGMHFMGNELITLLEQVLPARFGGRATDYQLAEEEIDGLPQVRLLVSPRLGDIDQGAVAATVLEALARGSGSNRMMSAVWRDSGTLAVVRQEPYATSAAKILPLHVVRGP